MKKIKKIRVIFKRELHIVNALKTNILINNNIINSKDIFKNLKKYTVIINNYNVIVFIEIKTSYNFSV